MICFLFLVVCPAIAWESAGHHRITAAALSVQPEPLLRRWEKPHHNAFHDREDSIAGYLAQVFCLHPDTLDGPRRPDRPGEDTVRLTERRRVAGYVYAELPIGEYARPVPRAELDWEDRRPNPKTYHYFTFRQEESNRGLALRGARWYFHRIREAFRAGHDADAAEYTGAFLHAVQDRMCPYHVWDGYADEREAFEDSMAEHGLQDPENSRGGNPANPSLFWSISVSGVRVDIAGYEPVLLGDTPETAAEAFVERLFENREYAAGIYTDREGFVQAHLADDWTSRGTSPETAYYLRQVANASARLCADVIFTAFTLSLDADPD